MTDDKPTTQIIIRAAQYPAVAVTFDETRAGIHVWIQTRPESLGGYAQGILLDADQAHVLLSALRASLDGKQELRTVNPGHWPRMEVALDATTEKVALWLQGGPGEPRGPVLRTFDQTKTLIDALHAAIDDRDEHYRQFGDHGFTED